MERQLLWSLYQRLGAFPQELPPKCSYSDTWIVLTYLWAVLSDRPISWSCRRENWPAGFLCCKPPSPATMSRRLQTPSVRKRLLKLLLQLQPPARPGELWYVDGKPLPLGGATGDPDARAGRGAGMLAKGYKLHLIYSSAGRLAALAVTPLNADEPHVAQRLLAELALRGYLIGDHLFDTNDTYDAGVRAGVQLLCSPQRQPPKGLGHQWHSPHRLAGLALAQSPAGRAMLRRRFDIDRFFGTLGNRAGGLAPLPNFVRRLHRVRLWVVGKLVLHYAARAEKRARAA